MPLRAAAFPVGPRINLNRRASVGTLAEFHFLDTRQYRSDQPCDDKFGTTCPGINDPRAEVLGRAQERWLADGIARSKSQWNVLAQQIMMMDLDRNAEHGVNTDSWAAYRVPRNRVLGQLQQRGTKNVVVLTGDEHKNFAGELHLDGRRAPALARDPRRLASTVCRDSHFCFLDNPGYLCGSVGEAVHVSVGRTQACIQGHAPARRRADDR